MHEHIPSDDVCFLRSIRHDIVEFISKTFLYTYASISQSAMITEEFL